MNLNPFDPNYLKSVNNFKRKQSPTRTQTQLTIKNKHQNYNKQLSEKAVDPGNNSNHQTIITSSFPLQE